MGQRIICAYICHTRKVRYMIAFWMKTGCENSHEIRYNIPKKIKYGSQTKVDAPESKLVARKVNELNLKCRWPNICTADLGCSGAPFKMKYAHKLIRSRLRLVVMTATMRRCIWFLSPAITWTFTLKMIKVTERRQQIYRLLSRVFRLFAHMCIFFYRFLCSTVHHICDSHRWETVH